MLATSVRLAAGLLLAVAIALPSSAFAAGGAIFIKGGSMFLQDDNQLFDTPTHVPVNVGLNNSSYKAIDVSWEIRFGRGWAVGTEYLGYDHRFTPSATPAARGVALTDAFMVSAKKYFLDSGKFHPYVGAGFGLGLTDISNNRNGGTINDLNASAFVHAMLGVELRVDNLSFLLEAKTLYFDNSTVDVEYDPTASGIFLGAGFNW